MIYRNLIVSSVNMKKIETEKGKVEQGQKGQRAALAGSGCGAEGYAGPFSRIAASAMLPRRATSLARAIHFHKLF